MLVSTINLSKIENFKDLSPEFYKQQFLELSSVVRSFRYRKLGSIAFVTDGEHGSPMWDRSSNIKYISAEFIKPNYIEDGITKTISPIQDLRNARARVRSNDVLIYSVGAYAGFAAQAEPHLFPANIPRSVAIVRLNTSEILSEYLTVFLNSKFGNFQSLRFRAGNSQPVLALEKIKQFEVPIISLDIQQRIGELYQKAYSKRLESRKLYTQATRLLYDELGLSTFQFKKEKNFITNFSDVVSSNRLDADHFTPLYDQLKSLLSKKEKVSPFFQLLEYCARGQQPIYDKSGIVVLNSKHIRTNKIDASLTRYAKAPNSQHFLIQKGDVLINGTGVGTIGRAAAFVENFAALPDNHVTILRSSKLDPCYLSLYLNSQAGQIQVNKYLRGSSGQIELYPNDIGKFLIWEAPQEFQKEIGDMIRDANTYEKQSKELLDQAKQDVETLIEQAAQSS